MKGIYLPGDRQTYIKQWPDPKWERNEVLIRIKASGLCRTDMSLYYGRPQVGRKEAGEVIPGHEPCGIVEDIGKDVRSVRKGDRVAIMCFIGCGHCRYCEGGEPNLCEEVQILGFDRHGGDAEYLVVPESVCLKISDGMSYVTGAVATDVVGNLYNTMKELEIIENEIVAIVGIGPMGLGAVVNAVALGGEVIAIDPVQKRLEKAEELGASYLINPAKDNVTKAVSSLTKGFGVEKIVECSGTESGVSTALAIASKHGKIAQVGGVAEIKIYPRKQLVHKKVCYFGSWYFSVSEWNEICDFIIEKISNSTVEAMVSHRYPLEERAVQEAFRLFDERKTYKVVFVP